MNEMEKSAIYHTFSNPSTDLIFTYHNSQVLVVRLADPLSIVAIAFGLVHTFSLEIDAWEANELGRHHCSIFEKRAVVVAVIRHDTVEPLFRTGRRQRQRNQTAELDFVATSVSFQKRMVSLFRHFEGHEIKHESRSFVDDEDAPDGLSSSW